MYGSLLIVPFRKVWQVPKRFEPSTSVHVAAPS